MKVLVRFYVSVPNTLCGCPRPRSARSRFGGLYRKIATASSRRTILIASLIPLNAFLVPLAFGPTAASGLQ